MKISIIGSGRVGSTVAFSLIERRLCDELVLIDIVKERAMGEALDLRHCLSALKTNIKIKGSNDYALTKGSDIIIVTAGVPRRPGDSRLDLSKKNAEIMKDVVKKIKKFNKHCLLFIVSNPVDVMTYLALKVSGFDPSKVFGLGTMLDTVRLKSLISEEYNIAAANLQAFVIGEHGDSMLPFFSKATLNGIPLIKRFKKDRLERIFRDTKIGAAEVIKKKGGTWFAPALAVSEVVESIVKDQKKTLPISMYREDLDVCIGFPSLVSKEGVKAMNLSLSKEENEKFLESIKILKNEIQKLGI